VYMNYKCGIIIIRLHIDNINILFPSGDGMKWSSFALCARPGSNCVDVHDYAVVWHMSSLMQPDDN